MSSNCFRWSEGWEARDQLSMQHLHSQLHLLCSLEGCFQHHHLNHWSHQQIQNQAERDRQPSAASSAQDQKTGSQKMSQHFHPWKRHWQQRTQSEHWLLQELSMRKEASSSHLKHWCSHWLMMYMTQYFIRKPCRIEVADQSRYMDRGEGQQED